MNEYTQTEGARLGNQPGKDSFGKDAPTVVGALAPTFTQIPIPSEEDEQLLETLSARADYEDNLLDRLGA
jgi:hypothetical protein